MNKIAQLQLQQRESAISEIRTVADAERRKKWVRETLLEIVGGLPDYRGPLNPRITGRIQAESYIIEKVIFESLPQYFITANLYRPRESGRYPAVLFPMGHHSMGKVAAERIAANLALPADVTIKLSKD